MGRDEGGFQPPDCWHCGHPYVEHEHSDPKVEWCTHIESVDRACNCFAYLPKPRLSLR
jgi:hypothetical protein